MCLFDLRGKTAAVTGAARGLGRAMAVGLAEAGADIAIADIIDTEDAVAEIKALGRKSFGIRIDVTKQASVSSMVRHVVRRFGRLDILVNNAGILRMSPAERLGEKDWDDVIRVNLKGQFLCAQAAGRHMIMQKSGKIINIASIAGLSGFMNTAAYNASKAGVISLTKTLAAEWGKHNINVNAICPGVFETAMTSSFLRDKKFTEMIKAKVPLGRYAQPEELKGAVVFLASGASRYVTGHALVVDGGWTAML